MSILAVCRKRGNPVARKRRLSLFVLIRALGFDEENEPGFLDRFVEHFHFLEGQWEKEKENAPTQDLIDSPCRTGCLAVGVP